MSTDRDQLAAALALNAWHELVDVRFALAALLPVVDRIANERAAAELRAAAFQMAATIDTVYLRDLADALDPS